MEKTKKLPVASVEIKGKTYNLAYDFNSIADVENESGGNLLTGLLNLADMSALQLRGLICAAIRAADKKSKITVKEVSELLTFDTIFPFSEALAQSILLSLRKKTEEPTAESAV